MSTEEDLREKGFAKAGVDRATHHLFLCLGPDCCDPAAGEIAWNHLKKRVGELGLSIMRTKARCFRICSGGPWLVVYPDGIWYGEATPERIDRILEEHVRNGRPVEAWIARVHPLPG
jgi:(2Fe-2S) ferredoxin